MFAAQDIVCYVGEDGYLVFLTHQLKVKPGSPRAPSFIDCLKYARCIAVMDGMIFGPLLHLGLHMPINCL